MTEPKILKRLQLLDYINSSGDELVGLSVEMAEAPKAGCKYES